MGAAHEARANALFRQQWEEQTAHLKDDPATAHANRADRAERALAEERRKTERLKRRLRLARLERDVEREERRRQGEANTRLLAENKTLRRRICELYGHAADLREKWRSLARLIRRTISPEQVQAYRETWEAEPQFPNP